MEREALLRSADNLDRKLRRLWEDTPIQTAGGVPIATVGHLEQILDGLLKLAQTESMV